MSKEAEQLLEWVANWQWARHINPGTALERRWHGHCAFLGSKLIQAGVV